MQLDEDTLDFWCDHYDCDRNGKPINKKAFSKEQQPIKENDENSIRCNNVYNNGNRDMDNKSMAFRKKTTK